MTELFHSYYVPELHNLDPGQVLVKAPMVGPHIQIGLDKELVAPLLQPLVVTCGQLPEESDAPARQVVTLARPDGAEFNLNDVDHTRRPDAKLLLVDKVMGLTVWSEDGEFWRLSSGVARQGTQDIFQEALGRVGSQARKAALTQLPLVRR